MDFSSIYISGNIVAYDLLERLDRDLERVPNQKAKDFGFESSTNMRQEISRTWEDASRQWLTFKSRKERLKETDKGTTETRTHWMMPLLSMLGYNLEFRKESETIGEKHYEVSHFDTLRDQLPVLINSFRDVLDKKPEGSRLRMSPHSLLQDYLNNSEHTFGLVTNGLQLRLLRDTGRISKPVYVEFNLEKIFDDSLYAEFVLLYRLLHASRMPPRREQAAESFIEHYHQEAIESGGRIRDQLSKAMENSIKILGRGLVQHPANTSLRSMIAEGKISEAAFYKVLLRLIYRMLFLMTIEERKLVYPENNSAELLRLAKIYDAAYSIERLRKLAGNRYRIEGRQHDLWLRLLQTLRLFEDERAAQHLGLHALGTGLFEPGAINPFDECKVTNAVLLEAIFPLSYFENENQTMQRINYRQMDVEEFGSVYQGLLDYKISFERAAINDASRWDMGLQSGTERSKSGTHYTPEELVQPLIKHSLDYLIADRKKIIDEKIKSKNLKGTANIAAREQLVAEHLLTLKVCDVACGSGHILISAARRIAEVSAAIIEEEEQPNPVSLRKAKREAIRHCVYGVDVNPMAVELCKVAMWLEAHNPCEPLNFLDHHIKCGDAIVGLAHRAELENGIADEAFKTLPGDTKEVASAFAKRNKEERKTKQGGLFDDALNAEVNFIIEEYKKFHHLPEHTPAEVNARAKAHRHYEQDVHRVRLRQLADAQVAQFFLPKTEAYKDELLTDAPYRNYLRQVNKGLGKLQGQQIAKAEVIAQQKNFFHWFLEFPEVFTEGGFDCILGNPPFLGGQKLSGAFGDDYLNWIKFNYAPAGSVDLVAYFFRRIFSVIRTNGFQSLISTNTISQGGTREGGLEIIVKNNGVINYAIKSLRWLGLAKVEVALLTIHKGAWNGKRILDGKEEDFISTYLDGTRTIGNPYKLIQNEMKCFQGCIPLGKGFILEPRQAQQLISKDARNKEVLFPYLNGEELNNSPDQSPSRWIINFSDWTLEKAKSYPECFSIVEALVKPERQREGNKMGREKWWQFYRRGVDLYNTIRENKNVIAISEVTKPVAFVFHRTDIIFSANLDVFSIANFSSFALLQNSLHYYWAWKYCAWLKRDLKYSPGNGFETFPFPQNLSPKTKQELEQIGEQYHEHRRQLMLLMQLGLTKTYNLFHTKNLTVSQVGKVSKQDEATSQKAYDGILQLRQLHKQMDETVLAAYGWQDVAMQHDFYEVEYLPENDRVRYTIHPDARKEILKRLLALNHKIHDEEVKAGLWEKKGKKKTESEIAETEEGHGMFKGEN